MIEKLPSILPQIKNVVQQAASFQLKHFRSMPAGSDNQKAVREMVSFVDVETEKILMDGLLPLVEGAGFFGEESGRTGAQDLVWIVDPLDGTSNYLSGLDQFSISIALVQDGQSLLGIVHKPATNETWSCIKGSGLYHNDTRVQPVSSSLTTQDALFITGFPYRSQDLAASFFACASEVLTLGRGIRRFCSADLDISNLSTGWAQGFWESDLEPYDVAAGLLFMQENGCVVTNHLGNPYNMFEDRIIVAALPGVHSALLSTVNKHYQL